MPHTPEAAIVHSLRSLDVPLHLWSPFLLCQAFSISGWCAWTKYQTYWTDTAGIESNDLAGLLAIRLAYDAALAEAQGLRLNWTSLVPSGSVSFKSPRTAPGDDSMVRYTLLRASEIGYRRELLESLSLADARPSVVEADRKLAQVVFCIDVRSERMRRQLEARSRDIETFGFAGFFGMAFEYIPSGEASGKPQLPVLLRPQFKLSEGLQESESPRETTLVSQRQQHTTWQALWKSFQTSTVGCFSFVETMGLFYGFKLLRRVVGSPLGAKL